MSYFQTPGVAMSHYSTLGILPLATSKEIQEAFLASALRAHPDLGGSDVQLQQVLRAFELLCEHKEQSIASCKQDPAEALGAQKKLCQLSATRKRIHGRVKWKRTRGEKLLSRLCRLLSSLPGDKRRSVLQNCFSQQQRLQLERWMLALPMGKVESEVGFHATSCCSSRTKSSSRRVQSVVQVTRRGKYKYYLASAAMEGLRMVTKTVGSLEVALSFHSILVVIKQRTTFLSGSFEARFRAALSSTLSEFKVDPDSMGLKFIISLRVLWMKAPLRTPAYFVASQLEKGLQALDRLRKARGCARNYVLRAVDKIELDRRWQRIRGEYLDVMLEAGCKKEVVEDRLEILDQERSSKLQEQSKRWLSAKGNGQHSDHGPSFGRKRKRALDDASLMTQRQIEVLVSRWSRKQR